MMGKVLRLDLMLILSYLFQRLELVLRSTEKSKLRLIIMRRKHHEE